MASDGPRKDPIRHFAQARDKARRCRSLAQRTVMTSRRSTCSDVGSLRAAPFHAVPRGRPAAERDRVGRARNRERRDQARSVEHGGAIRERLWSPRARCRGRLHVKGLLATLLALKARSGPDEAAPDRRAGRNCAPSFSSRPTPGSPLSPPRVTEESKADHQPCRDQCLWLVP